MEMVLFNAYGIDGYNWKICKKNYKYILLNNLAQSLSVVKKLLIETLNLKNFLKPLDLKII